ncbi:MAG: GNAT family N-acetyltransferase [Candidatus Bathyarchaeia archaeon]
MNGIGNLVVRSYREGDEDVWLHIVNESLKACLGYEPRVLSDFLRWKNSRHFDGRGLFFAQVGEAVVGTIAAVPLKYLAKKKGRITDLAVLPTHQRKGVGSALLEAGLSYLKGVGMKEAAAWSWNFPAFLDFYAKHGFQPVRRHLAIHWDFTKPLPKLTVNREVYVKEATVADIEVLAKLASKAYLPYWDWWYEDHGGAEKVRAYWRERVKNELEMGYAYFIAYAKKKPVGFSAAQIDKKLIKEKGVKLGTLWAGVAVLPEHRRKHIGSRLLREALTFLKRKGMEKAMVGTFSYLDSHTPAVNLYLKSGGIITREFVSLRKLL